MTKTAWPSSASPTMAMFFKPGTMARATATMSGSSRPDEMTGHVLLSGQLTIARLVDLAEDEGNVGKCARPQRQNKCQRTAAEADDDADGSVAVFRFQIPALFFLIGRCGEAAPVEIFQINGDRFARLVVDHGAQRAEHFGMEGAARVRLDENEDRARQRAPQARGLQMPKARSDKRRCASARICISSQVHAARR